MKKILLLPLVTIIACMLFGCLGADFGKAPEPLEIVKTGTSEEGDIYTVTFSDGQTASFTVPRQEPLPAPTVKQVDKLSEKDGECLFRATFTDGQEVTFTVSTLDNPSHTPKIDKIERSGETDTKYEYTAVFDNECEVKFTVDKIFPEKPSVSSVELASENDEALFYTVTFSDGSTTGFQLKKEKSEDGENGGFTPRGEVLPVKGGAGGIVVLMHDDGWTGRVTPGNLDGLCERYGLVNDVALLTSALKTDGAADATKIAWWQSYLDTGRWKVTSHSSTHTWWGTRTANSDGSYSYSDDTQKMTDEIVGSQEFLQSVFPNERVLTFAYPGFSAEKKYFDNDPEKILEYIYSPASRELLDERYISARAGGASSVGVTDRGTDWIYLSAYSVSNSTVKSGRDTEAVRLAAERGKLAVFYLHNVIEVAEDEVDTTTYASNTMALYYADKLYAEVARQVEAGAVWNTHYEDAVLYLREAQSASLSLFGDRGLIRCSLTDSLDDDIYNYPLTVRIDAPEGWEAAKVVDGCSVYYLPVTEIDGKAVIEAELTPDRGEVLFIPARLSDVPDVPDGEPDAPEEPSFVKVSYPLEVASEGVTVSGNMTEEYINDGLATKILKVTKSAVAASQSVTLEGFRNPTEVDKAAVSMRLKLDKPDTLGNPIIQILFAENSSYSPYILAISAQEDGFAIVDRSKTTGSAHTVLTGKLAYGEWHEIRLELSFALEGGFAATLYADGSVATSTKYCIQGGNTEPLRLFECVRFAFLKTTVATVYLDSVSIEAGTEREVSLWMDEK